MTRKLSLLFIILLLSLFITTPVLAAKSYYAEYFDVQIDIQEDGSAIITETVEFRFEGEPFTFAFREISATETDGLTFLDASMDGNPMPQGTGAGQVEIEDGDPLKVTWHFPPTSDTSHVFVIRYRANGIIRTGDADTLIWRAVPEDHDYSIEHSTITLTYPQQATLLEQPTLNREFESTVADDRIILTANGLTEDEDLILIARFAPNSLTQATPQWQVENEQSQAATARALPVGSIAGVLTLVLGVLGLFTYARANGRELTTSPVVSNATPPSDVPPALIGKLSGQAHGFMGTIFDLAKRGLLEISERTGFMGSKKHVLTRKEMNLSLSPHEQGLLDAIFKIGDTQTDMSEIAGRLASKHKLFDEPLEQELVQRGWLDLQRKSKRNMLLGSAFILIFFSIALFIGSLIGVNMALDNLTWVTFIAALGGVGVGLFFLSIALLIYASMFSILTPSGEEQAARWKGFAEYLKQVSKGKEPAISTDYFERYLPYAAVFGLGTKWAEYFQTLGGMPLPIWFHATAGSNAEFGAIIAVMSSSDSAGASASGGGGGAGASGGGSSGAG
ncbi:MAG: DUF2207 domain-containing protein [Anaerolineales bacterium]|nr:DUF2207 domain-containing protein [Anaerolineales bacterium]